MRWEADPTVTDAVIGVGLGVTDEAVRKRRHAELWERVASLRSINERAQFKADKKLVDKVGAQVGQPTAKSTELAEDIRADVLDRHRSDWIEYRELHPLAVRALDFDAGKRGKINAEALSLLHRGERAAYGLGEIDSGGKTGDELWAALDKDRGQRG